jgi:hypothetical protein
VYNTSGAWVESRDYWTVGGSGTPTWINQLLTQRNLALQATARRRYHGTIANVDYMPFKTFEINSKKYTLMSGTFNANRNEWQGDFHELSET